jgi:hypothetical protein
MITFGRECTNVLNANIMEITKMIVMLVDLLELVLLKTNFFWVGIAFFIFILHIACSVSACSVSSLPLLYGGGSVGDKRLVLDVHKILHVLTEHVYVT